MSNEGEAVHARVATFDYAASDPEDVRRGFEEIKRRATAGPPEGLPAVGVLDLYNPDDGKVLSITFFETEEDRRLGDATLSSMDPPPSGATGRRVSVEMFEVAVKIDT
jgi:hypothetical protein